MKNPQVPLQSVSYLEIFSQSDQRDSFVLASRSVLVATNQTEFTLKALPTRRGRTRRTRDMAEMYACIFGDIVESQARVEGSNTAMRCGFKGCGTSWVH